MSIVVSELTKKYALQIANDSISLEIKKGEIIALLGVNGAGKSTLMKTISGAIRADKGKIEIDHLTIEKQPNEYKNKIGFLAENNPLYQDLFVKEYLIFVANLMKINKETVNDVIEKVGLKTEISKKIHQLSKGYKQRVGLAQALLHQPDYLILDEPTSGLDPNQIIEIRELIKEIGKEKTVILSTHIMQEVEVLCSRVILLHNGKLIKDCSLNEFKTNFETLEQAFIYYTREPLKTQY